MTATILPSAPLASRSATASRRAPWIGRALSGIAVLFLAVDTLGKLLAVQPVIEGTVKLGFAPGQVVTLGVVELLCLATYLVPRTAPLGAVLWTGFLGGAVATHLRLGNPLLTHTLFPILVAALLWGGLWLRDARVRALLAGAR